RARLRDEEEFKTFLDHNPRGFIANSQSDTLPENVAEEYCRWRHAERVFHALGEFEAAGEPLRWGPVPFKRELGNVCWSHNLDVERLKRDEFDNDFLHCCDLRFCAI